jgi:hypothetical protein
MLVWRDMKNTRRDSSVIFVRVVQSALMALLIGTIFHGVGSLSTASAKNLQSQFGAIVIVSCCIMMGPANEALMAFPAERPVFLREYTTKHYSVTAYFLSRLVVEAVLGGVQTFITVSRALRVLTRSLVLVIVGAHLLARFAHVALSWQSRTS